MKKYIELIVFFLVCFVSKNTYSQEWISFDKTGNKKDAITIDVLESNQYIYKAKFYIHGIIDYPTTNKNVLYHQLTFGNGGHLNMLGAPSLPTISQFISIPPRSIFKASLIEEKWSNIDIGKVYPVQNPCIGLDTLPDMYINELSYRKDFTPTLLSIDNETEWRKIKCRNVVICPFKYYPTEGKLSILKEFTLQVDFFPKNEGRDKKELLEVNDEFKLFANKVFIDEALQSPSRLNSAYDYLIIVGSGMSNIIGSDKMREYRIWKALKGYKTKVVDIDTIGTTPAMIKNFILQEYNNNGISYVLFVGDDNKIPVGSVSSSNNGNISSDYWYGCLSNSNAIADIPVGRFSTNVLGEFKNMVDKSIKYERTYNATNKVLLVAHNEYAPQQYQNCCNQIMNPTPDYTENMTFIKAYGAPSGSPFYGTNAKNDTVLYYINNGAQIINYRGHGSANYWGNPYWNVFSETFHENLINSMNDETCAIFFSIACQTGNIINQTSMLETFLRAQNGAAAFVGATEDTDTDSNNIYNQSLFKKLLNDGVYKIGDLNISAHSFSINNSNNYSLCKDVAYSYIIGGDPSLEIWTDTPCSFGIVNMTESNNVITLNTGMTGGYHVSISSIDGDFIQTLSPSSNMCSFNKPANQFIISIYRHNYFPKIIYYDSVSTSIVNMTFDYDAYYTASPLDIHTEAAQYDEDEGTKVKSGSKLVVNKGNGGVTIYEDFECEEGASFEIR